MARMKINSQQLPVKAHFFFFMAAMGPILPFLPVYGKQIGISPMVMGSITAILPIMFLIAKPAFGLLVDHFRDWRKSLFIGLLAVTSCCYVLMYFLPVVPLPLLPQREFKNVSCLDLEVCTPRNVTGKESCFLRNNVTCWWNCQGRSRSFETTYYRGQQEFSPNTTCLQNNATCTSGATCDVICNDFTEICTYMSSTFWGFILLMSLGNIGFNVANCISDAICFDVLGEGGQMGYGRQRVWGTIGFGITAFLAGYSIDYVSQGESIKSYTPAFILVLAFTLIDLLCCSKLELPIMSRSDNIIGDVFKLVRMTPIAVFLCFATLAGILDSFLIYFLFWYIEDLAIATNYMNEIKLIEGLIVAAETLGGEVIFFTFSGKILKKLGYGYCFALCFVCYAVRLGLISLAPTPWWVVPIEFFMQGPTYALCYTTIVAYASAISPPGTSATVQGIVAGMDDGFGFAVGSFIGGILYKDVGGVKTLRIFSSIAIISAFTYLLLYTTYLKRSMPKTRKNGLLLYNNELKIPFVFDTAIPFIIILTGKPKSIDCKMPENTAEEMVALPSTL
ncbi:major facilitator superfamily domain-containing protein 6 isoform X2 [Orussus abietinus]|nr:major facilitator superfamily domain-containing protein 6 isoform X2 [Orussus abietinus]XP_023287707.1 major facilitator superfamily domain-containing protein 6 isoform X2 [Orussus abietinus]XP_023287708.1 major facilitator superfamily domain-containing protein 6 isoform X2 [Orussus abietinus]XP_023287709.1 major facilitator superfamily domain-containing protein 6 isoform X2 [Orussus abietinus]XP_023287710.1 major facilitator superfamily domain-containing protein 6 isoform X2 [Orussus abieti